MLGKYQDAIQRYDRAIALRPGFADAEANRALAKLRAERLAAQAGGQESAESNAPDPRSERPDQTGKVDHPDKEPPQPPDRDERRRGAGAVAEARADAARRFPAGPFRLPAAAPAPACGRAPMRRAPVLLVCIRLVLAALPGWAGAASAEEPTPTENPVVRTSVDPADPVVDQHVALIVEVLFPGRMRAPPRVEAAQAPSLQVFRLESQGLTIRETIDGAPYIGQQFEFAVYPRRAGPLTIPPVAVRLMDRSGDETGTVSGQAKTLAVAAPPGVDRLYLSFASRREAGEVEDASLPDPPQGR
jgi:hypothetical protein